MTTKVVIATTTWQLANTGATYMSVAKASDQATPSYLPLQSNLYEPQVLWAIGTTLPSAGTFAYHELTDDYSYPGTEDVYVRTISGTRVLKVSPIV